MVSNGVSREESRPEHYERYQRWNPEPRRSPYAASSEARPSGTEILTSAWDIIAGRHDRWLVASQVTRVGRGSNRKSWAPKRMEMLSGSIRTAICSPARWRNHPDRSAGNEYSWQMQTMRAEGPQLTKAADCPLRSNLPYFPEHFWRLEDSLGF